MQRISINIKTKNSTKNTRHKTKKQVQEKLGLTLPWRIRLQKIYPKLLSRQRLLT